MTSIRKGCRAAFAVGGSIALLVTLGCATPRTPEQRAADSDVKARVEAALSSDPRIYARHVEVNVDEGVVHLGGFVWSDSEMRFAKADAAAVPGVRAVADQIELMRGGMSGGASR
jgi:osmotically-inducible protein OsmY